MSESAWSTYTSSISTGPVYKRAVKAYFAAEIE
jgi:hypothetical protein